MGVSGGDIAGSLDFCPGGDTFQKDRTSCFCLTLAGPGSKPVSAHTLMSDSAAESAGQKADKPLSQWPLRRCSWAENLAVSLKLHSHRRSDPQEVDCLGAVIFILGR